ncbi:hypothetical protein F2Q68_00008886 [Brassica cretica]|uniref:PPM-type phosphatase domain-containing protein n=1 Tax=Brassica cretica TaxID=69181 RepID=A0A8S9KWC6_BRACR|nr:hypothetical protein F2Q68_00008886 [Brassica cretica]
MGRRYSYSQPSDSEEYGGEIADIGYISTEELIRRDQAELSINYCAPAQYPPQPEVDEGECHVWKWWDVAVMEEMRARDRHILQLAEKVDSLTFLRETSGTTVTFVIIDGWIITVGSVGDSRCILDTQGGVVSLLTVDHRLEENVEDRERITASGGEVGRLNVFGGNAVGPLRCWPGGLCLSRSIGDTDVGEYIVPTLLIEMFASVLARSRCLYSVCDLRDLTFDNSMVMADPPDLPLSPMSRGTPMEEAQGLDQVLKSGLKITEIKEKDTKDDDRVRILPIRSQGSWVGAVQDGEIREDDGKTTRVVTTGEKVQESNLNEEENLDITDEVEEVIEQGKEIRDDENKMSGDGKTPETKKADHNEEWADVSPGKASRSHKELKFGQVSILTKSRFSVLASDDEEELMETEVNDEEQKEGVNDEEQKDEDVEDSSEEKEEELVLPRQCLPRDSKFNHRYLKGVHKGP